MAVALQHDDFVVGGTKWSRDGATPSIATPVVRSVHNDTMTVRALLVEDDAFTRTTLASALRVHGIQVVAVAEGVESGMEAARMHPFDVAILDLDLGAGPTGIDLAHGLRRLRPEVGIVMLTSFSDPRLLTSRLADLPLGSSYVVKQALQSMELLTAALEAAVDRRGTGIPAEPVSGLTQAQVETLRLLSCGLSNAEIARVRVVTEKSVEQAIARTAKRLGVSASPSVNQRVALAREYFQLTGAMRGARSSG